jgi:hypothetical protein
LEQQDTQSKEIGHKSNLWLLEGFASRAALLGFIYLCINFIYQLGYLSKLGINFGLFSLTKSFPVFENFLIAFYSFLIWGALVETSGSTYDQVFGFFKPSSWRDLDTKKYRYFTLMSLAFMYFILRAVYLIIYGSGIYKYNLFGGSGVLNFARIILLFLSPNWEFISWSVTFIFVSTLLVFFFLLKKKYRKIRSGSLLQVEDKNIRFMQFYINAISPAAAILGCLFLLIIIPSVVGRLTVDLTIYNFKFKRTQMVSYIEIVDIDTFCRANLSSNGDTYSWKSKSTDSFTMHLLGEIGEFNVFVRIEKQNKNNNILYTLCLVDSGSIKSIEFPQRVSY